MDWLTDWLTDRPTDWLTDNEHTKMYNIYIIRMYIHVVYSCNIGTSDFPDMYAKRLSAKGI